jgi:hypothetical protein
MPTPLAHHVILRRASNAVLAPTTAARRALARAVLSAGRDAELFAFFAPDGHLHAAVGADRAAAGRFAQRALLALRAALPGGGDFAPAYVKPVEDQAHLRRLVPYILDQAAHHGVSAPVGLEASNLPDLLGLRVTGAYTIPNLRARLPRLDGAELRRWLGVADLAPRLVPEGLADAAAAAVGRAELTGREPEVLDAKGAGVRAARGVLTPTEAGARLGLPRATAWRLAERTVPDTLVRAVLLQCDARARLGAALSPALPYSDAAAH